VELKLHSIKSF